jgi:uncharacterized membrane protein HdeD (DUF308 family)
MHPRGDRLSQQADPVDEQVVALLASSALVRRADRAAQLAAKEIRSSAVADTLRRAAAAWSVVTAARRRFSIGLTLVVSSVVNVGLTTATGSVPGWLWMVIPGLAATIGAVMMVFGAAAREERD